MAHYQEKQTVTDMTFGRYKIEMADKLRLKDTKDLSKVFGLSASKVDEIERSGNHGLTFLNILENNLQIGPDLGVDQLLDALKEIDLLQVADFAEQKFLEFIACRRSVTPSSEQSVLDHGSEISFDNSKEQRRLEKILRDELTMRECFELATYFGWPAGVVDNIRLSDYDYTERLINNLYRRHINISRLDLLLHALNDCKILRVRNLVESLLCETADRRLKSEEDSNKVVCICGQDAFEELKSTDGELLCLHCVMCSADWKLLPTGSTPSAHQPRIQKYQKTFIYKVPIRVNLSNFRHELVTNLEELTPGDHIYFRMAYGLFRNHAIYVSRQGYQIEVIHWTFRSIFESLRCTFNLSDEKFISIKREYKPFPSYGVGRVCYDGKDDEADLTVARAFQMLHKTDERYSLMQNNCENLATYCKVGKGFTIYGGRVGDIHPLFQME